MHVQGRQHPPSDTLCSPLTVLRHGTFQAGNKSFFWTDPSDTLRIRRAKGTESSRLRCLCAVSRRLVSATLPTPRTAGKTGSALGILFSEQVCLYPTTTRCIRLKSGCELEDSSSKELQLQNATCLRTLKEGSKMLLKIYFKKMSSMFQFNVT